MLRVKVKHPNTVFLPFKNKHEGETAIIIASGPSVEKFVPTEKEKEEAYFIGVNAQGYQFKQHPLDYWFYGDVPPMHEMDFWVKKNPETSRSLQEDTKWKPPKGMPYKWNLTWATEHEQRICLPFFKSINPKLEKFGHITHLGANGVKITGGIPYFIGSVKSPYKYIFYNDIGYYPPIHGSIVYSAVQFALYAGFSKLFLVGCDSDREYTYLIGIWGLFKELIKRHYPHVRVVSINPVNDIGFESIVRH